MAESCSGGGETTSESSVGSEADGAAAVSIGRTSLPSIASFSRSLTSMMSCVQDGCEESKIIPSSSSDTLQSINMRRYSGTWSLRAFTLSSICAWVNFFKKRRFSSSCDGNVGKDIESHEVIAYKATQWDPCLPMY